MRFTSALLLCLSAPALAQPAPPTAPPAPSAAPTAPSAAPPAPSAAPTLALAQKPVSSLDKVKCRKEMPIGSMVPKRVCTTERTENYNRDEARNALVRPQHLNQQ
jgi:hypothetical protein